MQFIKKKKKNNFDMFDSQSMWSLCADSCQADQKGFLIFLFFFPTVSSLRDCKELTGEQGSSFLFCLRMCFGSINLDQLEAALATVHAFQTLNP